AGQEKQGLQSVDPPREGLAPNQLLGQAVAAAAGLSRLAPEGATDGRADPRSPPQVPQRGGAVRPTVRLPGDRRAAARLVCPGVRGAVAGRRPGRGRRPVLPPPTHVRRTRTAVRQLGGEAGALAGSLAAGVALMVALPYWRDCLKFSGGGSLDEMR